jgi:hypothetical protein
MSGYEVVLSVRQLWLQVNMHGNMARPVSINVAVQKGLLLTFCMCNILLTTDNREKAYCKTKRNLFF